VGDALLCYSNIAFFLKPGAPIPHDHTNRWESWQIANTLLELGYRVDVINDDNDRFVPTRNYSVFIGNRTNFDRISALLAKDCIRILHIDTCHWLFHNLAEYRRLDALKTRRGFVLPAQRTMSPNRAIEHADYAISLGNEATMSTYRYSGKPLFRVPSSAPLGYAWKDKDFAAVRKSFLWLGSHGFVHKGLDLVLEAFAEMPDYQLTVCAPLLADKSFVRAYHRELYATKNIRTLGWIDVTSPKFEEVASECVGTVFASSSEGGSGAVITGMHAGLIPLVTYESAVDIDESHGMMLKGSSISDIKQTVRKLASLPPERLQEMARKNWEIARSKHTRPAFASTYASVLSEILMTAANRKKGAEAPAASRSLSEQLTYPEAPVSK
jgi:glycosyltransferase involved in cell wall biosynthesis